MCMIGVIRETGKGEKINIEGDIILKMNEDYEDNNVKVKIYFIFRERERFTKYHYKVRR